MVACERSLKRLGTDRIDLYLLHWRGKVPLPETMAAFAKLQRDGKIRLYGFSNFDMHDTRDMRDMRDLWQVPGGEAVQVNQLL